MRSLIRFVFLFSSQTRFNCLLVNKISLLLQQWQECRLLRRPRLIGKTLFQIMQEFQQVIENTSHLDGLCSYRQHHSLFSARNWSTADPDWTAQLVASRLIVFWKQFHRSKLAVMLVFCRPSVAWQVKFSSSWIKRSKRSLLLKGCWEMNENWVYWTTSSRWAAAVAAMTRSCKR